MSVPDGDTPQAFSFAWLYQEADRATSRARGTLAEHMVPDEINHLSAISFAAAELLEALAATFHNPVSTRASEAFTIARNSTYNAFTWAIRELETYRYDSANAQRYRREQITHRREELA